MYTVKTSTDADDTMRYVLDPRSTHRERGDIVRLADQNIRVPEMDEVGLFAVPCIIEATGQSTWLCVDGAGRVLKREPSLTHMVMWIVRTYNDKATLTDVARAVL